MILDIIYKIDKHINNIHFLGYKIFPSRRCVSIYFLGDANIDVKDVYQLNMFGNSSVIYNLNNVSNSIKCFEFDVPFNFFEEFYKSSTQKLIYICEYGIVKNNHIHITDYGIADIYNIIPYSIAVYANSKLSNTDDLLFNHFRYADIFLRELN